MDTFREDIENIFDKQKFELSRNPIHAFDANLIYSDEFRVNHYLIKLKNDSRLYIINMPMQIRDLIIDAIEYCRVSKIRIRDRYIYLTVDTKSIEVGQTQRDEGWHFDGMQGAEVPIKKKADFMFIISNKLGTEYFSKPLFVRNNLNENTHNYFNYFGGQISGPSGYCKSNKAYLLSGYQMHRCQKAKKHTDDRIFVRVHFSEVPITSVKMTVNPDVKYDYQIHATTGEIPDYLI